jgi:hypothetical protein
MMVTLLAVNFPVSLAVSILFVFIFSKPVVRALRVEKAG